MRFVRRWRPRHLLLAWGAYWLALALVTLGRPALAVWRMSRGPEGTGKVSAGVEDAIATLTVVDRGATVWTGAASLPWITVWLVAPPLLLWALWLLLSRRADAAAGPDAVRAPAAPLALHPPLPTELGRVGDRPVAVPAEPSDR